VRHAVVAAATDVVAFSPIDPQNVAVDISSSERELMARSPRSLLQLGNGKLGRAIHVWSIPAVETCPGSTAVCRGVCYALQHRFRFASVRRRLDWNWRQSRRDDFVDRMSGEIRASGVLVLRLHVAGDFYDAQYAQKWLTIVKRSPRVRFFAFTRSWRIPALVPVLKELAACRAMRLWLSTDDETGTPSAELKDARVTYLQTAPSSLPAEADLVFRVRRLRQLPALPIVCEQETSLGKQLGVTCGSCKRCFQ
jgi:hypothetical protein